MKTAALDRSAHAAGGIVALVTCGMGLALTARSAAGQQEAPLAEAVALQAAPVDELSVPQSPFLLHGQLRAVRALPGPAAGDGHAEAPPFQFDERYVLELPAAVDRAAWLKGLLADGLQAHYGEGRQDGLQTLGDVIAALRSLTEDERAAKWAAWKAHCPKLCAELQPVLDDLLEAPFKIHFFEDCEPTDACKDHWLSKDMERDDLEWTTAQGAVLAIQAPVGHQPALQDAQRAVDCLKRADQDLDAALQWKDSEYPYTKLDVLSGPFSCGPDGSTRAVVHFECRDGDTQVDLALRTRRDTPISIVSDYYALTRRMGTQSGGPRAAPRDDMYWLAGRDSCMAVRDQAGHFVALLVVTAYGYDSTQDTLWFGAEDPQQSIQDNLGNIVKAAQACWNGP
jgi:hypothetical protein